MEQKILELYEIAKNPENENSKDAINELQNIIQNSDNIEISRLAIDKLCEIAKDPKNENSEKAICKLITIIRGSKSEAVCNITIDKLCEIVKDPENENNEKVVFMLKEIANFNYSIKNIDIIISKKLIDIYNNTSQEYLLDNLKIIIRDTKKIEVAELIANKLEEVFASDPKELISTFKFVKKWNFDKKIKQFIDSKIKIEEQKMEEQKMEEKRVFSKQLDDMALLLDGIIDKSNIEIIQQNYNLYKKVINSDDITAISNTLKDVFNNEKIEFKTDEEKQNLLKTREFIRIMCYKHMDIIRNMANNDSLSVFDVVGIDKIIKQNGILIETEVYINR